jgi:CDP-2,3-bis-(O-geranylgeranyl)-sn-glycerol synthase
MLTHALSSGSEDSDAPFIDPMTGVTSDAWFWLGGEWGTVFVLGCVLGFGCMVGDSAGSFIKRRLGHKREGDVSSHAPLLDTLPFALSTFMFGQIILDPSIVGSSELLMGMGILLFITPILHRAFNMLGYRLGLKSVPY